MAMPAQDHANLTITIALAHAAKGQGFTLTAAHAAGVTIPTRPGRAGWAARWADRVADEVLAHLALADAVDGEDLQALQQERRLDAARSAAGASTIVALTEGEAMGHPDWGVSAAWDLLTDA